MKGTNRFGALFRRFLSEIHVYRLVLKHKRTPRLAKWCLGVAIAYAINPLDIIPDFIPVIGHLDDVVVIPILIWIAFKLIPKDVVRECREIYALCIKDKT